jgi:hypothetical protein
VGAAFAAGTAPAWEPDSNAAAPYGNVIFYDANGDQVTSGTNLASPFAYAVASSAADPGATETYLAFANPTHGEPPSLWTSEYAAGPTTFSPAFSLPSGMPADIAAFASSATVYPVVAAGSSASITSWLTTNTPDTTTGYANTIEVRLTDSGAGRHGNPTGTYWDSDIGYNTTSSPITVDGTTVPANGWALLFPLVTPSTVSLTTSATGGHLNNGTAITLTATASVSEAGDAVQFFDNGTYIPGSFTTYTGTGDTYTFTYTPANNSSNVYTASFVPNVGDETGAYSTSATIVGGSTSSSVPVVDGTVTTAAVTVTKFSPKRLGQGASDIGVTISGTNFVAGAKVRVAGISFSSVKVVNSTTITAKAKAASSAKVGTTTVTVADSVGLGSCTTCLTIVVGPTVKSITPSLLRPGASEPVTIKGTGFLSGASVTGPTGVTVSKIKVVSSTKITATMKVSSRAKAGKDLPVTVVNGTAGGGGRGTGKALTIVANPTVKSMTPSLLRPGASASVTIKGTGFLRGATVTGPAGVKFSKVKVVSSSRITATVKVASSAKAGKDLPVTVSDGVAGAGGLGTGKVLTIR